MNFHKLLYLYYRITPLFLIVDVMFAAPIRVSFISSPNIRYAYYAFCFACSILFRYKPVLATRIAYTELAANFILIILAIMLPIYQALDLVEQGIDPTFNEAKIINLGMSGALLVFGFYSRQHHSQKSVE